MPRGLFNAPSKAVQRPVVRRSKFGAVRTVVNSFTFASKAESARYQALLVLGACGYIRNLELQPRFPLIVNGCVIGAYIADFRYEECVSAVPFQLEQVNGWRDIVEDVKGWRTLPMARWKMKHFTAQYGLTVREIR